MQKTMSSARHTGSQMRCQVGMMRNHSMTSATAMRENPKFTSENRTFCTGNTKRWTLTFLSSDELSMIDMRACEVESLMTVKVTLPMMR